VNNFIPISRRLFKHYLWNEKRKYSKFEAWLDLLQMVSFTNDNSTMINGQLCKWGRGQYPISISFLCERWGWTQKPVRTFLSRAQLDGMIRLERASKWTMLTICKYESYNKLGQSEVNQGAIKGQQLNKENKKENILKASEWKNILMKNNRINEEEFARQLDRFYTVSDFTREIEAIKSHFGNWLPKQELKRTKLVLKDWDDVDEYLKNGGKL